MALCSFPKIFPKYSLCRFPPSFPSVLNENYAGKLRGKLYIDVHYDQRSVSLGAGGEGEGVRAEILLEKLRFKVYTAQKQTGSHFFKNQRLLRATSWNLLELKSVPFVRCFS